MKDSEKADRNVDAPAIIKAVMDAVGMNAPAFANAIGINYQRVYDLMRGRTKKFNPGVANLICRRFPQINISYLYTGLGDVTIPVTEAAQQKEDPADEPPEPTDAETLLARVATSLDRATETTSRLMEWERDLISRERGILLKEHELAVRELAVAKREQELGLKP